VSKTTDKQNYLHVNSLVINFYHVIEKIVTASARAAEVMAITLSFCVQSGKE